MVGANWIYYRTDSSFSVCGKIDLIYNQATGNYTACPILGGLLWFKEMDMISEFPLWKSRKFWIVVMDVLVSSALFFGAKYLAPAVFDDIKFVIGVIQAPVLLLIAAYTVQNVKLADK